MTTPRRMLITGGTGQTGSRLAEKLVQRGHRPRLASRSGTLPGKIPGAEAVRFDWSDERTHEPAIAGSDAVYLVSPLLEHDPYPQMEAFIARALHAGVRRFVLLSSSALPEGGPAMGQVHRLLHERAPEWTVLQPSWFMQNFIRQHTPTIRDEGLVYSATADGRIPFIHVDDIAEVAARALTDRDPHNAAHVLTGPEAISYGEAATIIGQACGKTVTHYRLTESQLIERWTSQGMSREYAAMLAAMDAAIAGGAEGRVTDAVLALTGRTPHTFREFAQQHAQAWR